MTMDRGIGPYFIADANGTIILKDIKYRDLAEHIIELANSYVEKRLAK